MATTEIDLSAIKPDILYTADQAASIRQKSVKTLANERAQRRGPPVTYVGAGCGSEARITPE